FAEAIGWALAQHLGAEGPGCAVASVDGCPTWCSKYVRSHVHWSPRAGKRVDDWDPLGATYAIDAVIGVQDRHHRNILLAPNENKGRRSLWSIDFGNAGVQYSSFGDCELSLWEPISVADGIP